MKRIAYLDIIGGISGDMLIAAMLDAGLPPDPFHRELRKIVPKGFQIQLNKTSRGSINATHAKFPTEDGTEQRMGWRDFDECIRSSQLPDADNEKIRAIFECLKRAEAASHGDSPGTTHLHELGTLDTLIDIAGAVVGLRMLDVDTLHASPFPASIGMSSSSHGKGASFAPATMAIIQQSKIPVRVAGMNPPVGESVTPTGAAIAATLATFQTATMQIESVGYGAGTRDSDTPPNVVGLRLGEAMNQDRDLVETADMIGAELQTDTVLIETNLDDMTGEELGFATQTLFDLGALDVWVTPIQMKKSRPGSMLSVICRRRDLEQITRGFFTHTTTLGVRVRHLDRLVAQRETIEVQTPYGPIRVKTRLIGGIVTRVAPEYDDCAKIATEQDVPLGRVFEAAKIAASEFIGDLE